MNLEIELGKKIQKMDLHKALNEISFKEIDFRAFSDFDELKKYFIGEDRTFYAEVLCMGQKKKVVTDELAYWGGHHIISNNGNGEIWISENSLNSEIAMATNYVLKDGSRIFIPDGYKTMIEIANPEIKNKLLEAVQ